MNTVKKSVHRSAAALYLYSFQRQQGFRTYIAKPHLNVRWHNGNMVIVTDHTAAWEKRYAQYVDQNSTIVRL